MTEQTFLFGDFTTQEWAELSGPTLHTEPAGTPVPAQQVAPEQNYEQQRSEAPGTSAAVHAAASTAQVAAQQQALVQPPTTAPAAPKPAPVSWAAAVGHHHAQHSQPPTAKRGQERASNHAPAVKDDEEARQAKFKQLLLHGPSNILSNAAVFQPRGLINTGNTCFANATLQALLAVTPFASLLQTLQAQKQLPGSAPTLVAFKEFASFFVPAGPQAQTPAVKDDGKDAEVITTGNPFAPSMFDPVVARLRPNKPGTQIKSRQEDAQEFLSLVMDNLHDEMQALAGGQAAPTPPLVVGNDDDEWEEVSKGKRTAITRRHAAGESAVMSIFGGTLRSTVKSHGAKSSATLQPFTLLQLNILPDEICSVEDALHALAIPENLESYRAGGAGREVSARKSLQIESPPRVLILHLMRFAYSAQGSSKVHKPVSYLETLSLPLELLARRRKVVYNLVATVCHHGKQPSGGHYTASVRYAGSKWLRFDDDFVSQVPVSRVLSEQAYLLVYQQAGSQ
eukprot:jgi/Chlat1/9216/Chrsp98S08482